MPASFKKLILRNLSSMIIAIFRTVSHLQNLYYPSLLEEFSTDLSNVLFIIFICLAFSNKGFDFDFFFFLSLEILIVVTRSLQEMNICSCT